VRNQYRVLIEKYALVENKSIHWEFDQSPNSPWRALAQKGNYKGAIDTIKQFVKQNGWGGPEDSVLMWHLFQMYAMDEQRGKAKQLLQYIINKGVWNDYYSRGTLAWYNNDREGLEKEIQQATNDKEYSTHNSNNINILQKMLNGIGKSYKDVY
jgi:hypothetical protein